VKEMANKVFSTSLLHKLKTQLK